MAETFHIFILPGEDPAGIVTSLDTHLRGLGWEREWVARFDAEARREYARGSLKRVLGAKSLEVAYGRASRWLQVQSDSRPYRWISLGSDVTFFPGDDAQTELRSLFARIPLKDGTLVLGDREGRTATIGTSPRRELASAARLRNVGFFWIDTFPALRWQALLRLAPSLANRVLAVIGDARAVFMWEAPYTLKGQYRHEPALDAQEALRPLARKLASLSR